MTSAALRIGPYQGAKGQITLPGSKSISNRALLLSALASGKTTLKQLLDADDTQVMRPEIRAWLPRVTLQEAPGTILPRWSQVRIECANGRVLAQRINTARGDAVDPLSDAELIEKVADCFAFGKCDTDASAFSRQVLGLSTRHVGNVIRGLNASK